MWVVNFLYNAQYVLHNHNQPKLSNALTPKLALNSAKTQVSQDQNHPQLMLTTMNSWPQKPQTHRSRQTETVQKLTRNILIKKYWMRSRMKLARIAYFVILDLMRPCRMFQDQQGWFFFRNFLKSFLHLKNFESFELLCFSSDFSKICYNG